MMSVRETIIEKIMACGYDMFTACQEADRVISEFRSSGKRKHSVGIMGAHDKCLDVITIARRTHGVR